LETETEQIIKQKDKRQVKEIEEKILTFLQSQNSYKKSLQKEAQNLLDKLEKSQQTSVSSSSKLTIGEKIG
jgi:hypothetical protein